MRKHFALLLGLGLCALALSSARADNWARFRGPNGTGVATDKNVPVTFSGTENVLWKFPLPGVGNASPVIWGTTLFIPNSSADGSKRLLHAIDVTTGKELWARGIPAAKGEYSHKKSSFCNASPVTDGEGVYVPFWDGKQVLLVAYNFKGDVLWNKNLGTFISQHGPGASPIIYKDKVIFYNDMDKDDPKTKAPVNKPSTLYVFNKKTGDIAWELPREAYRACYTAPFILQTPGQPDEMIITSTTAITSYNPDNGAQNWKTQIVYKGKMPLRTIAGSHYHNDMLFACSGDGGGDRMMNAFALNGAGKNTQPKWLWENRKDFPYVPCLLSKGEHLYFVNDAGFAGCYEAKTGKRIWLERLPDAKGMTASPVMIDDKIYAPSEEGDVHVFAASPVYTPLARNNLGERVRATPAVADGRLYLRGQDHLFCIGKK